MPEVCEVVQVEGGIVVGHDGSKCAQDGAPVGRAPGPARRPGAPRRPFLGDDDARRSRRVDGRGTCPPLADWEKAVLDELTGHVAAAGLDPAVRVTCHAVHKSAVQALHRAPPRARISWSSAPGAAAASPGSCSARSATSSCTTPRAR